MLSIEKVPDTCSSCKHLGAVVKFCGNIDHLEFYVCNYVGNYGTESRTLKVKLTDNCHIDKYEYSELDFIL